MKKILETRFVISGFFGFLSPIASNEFLKDYFKDKIQSQRYREGAIIGILLILAGVMVKISILVYDKWIWKLLHPKLNIGGYWRYVNTYEDGRPATEGVVKIEQSPFNIQIKQGKSIPNSAAGKYTSTMISLAMDFVDSENINMAYEVSRNEEGKVRTNKKSLEKLRIVERHPGISAIPTKMESYFWNCVRNRAEDAVVNDYYGRDGWPVTSGSCTYVRCTKKDFQAAS